MPEETANDWAQAPVMMRVRDIQFLFGVSQKTAYDLVNRRDFPKLRVGRAIRVPKAALQRWVEARTEA
jgi:excisionase family DNA binding protein